MSNNKAEEKSEPQQEEDQNEPLVVKMGDDLIAVIRELVQLTLLTGTNVVDHLRAVRCEIDEETNKLVPTVEYVEAYNEMVEQLVEKAKAASQALESPSITKEDLAEGKFTVGVVEGGTDPDLN